MEKQGSREIATFPELFDGLEQFIEEQSDGIKRTSGIVAIVAMTCGALLFFVLEKLG